jgi:asparagine synthase (glutamine-hydrolysing)
MSLTGGLDGRMIMACAPSPPRSLPCYSFAGPVRDCLDATHARRVAAACAQPHEVLRVDEAFLERFAPLAARAVYLSDGTMDVTGSVELYVNALARAQAPVRLTGNYGSEVLRSNVAFGPQQVDQALFAHELASPLSQAAATYAQEAAGSRLALIVGKQVPWHHPARLSLEQTQVTMRSPYLDAALVQLAFRCPPALALAKQPALRFVARHRPGLARIPTDRGLVEPARPLVTHACHLAREAEFRAEYLWDYGMPHRLARLEHLLHRWHPERCFLGRHKFYHFRVWYRDRLGGSLQEVLLDTRTRQRGLIEPQRLQALVREHLAGTHNHTLALHQAMSVELLHRELLEREWSTAVAPMQAGAPA